MRHWTGRADFLDFQGDGIGFVHSDPDGQDGVAAGIFENNNGSIGYGIEHQASDFHFYFHCDSLQTKTIQPLRTLSYTKENILLMTPSHLPGCLGILL